MSRIKVRLIKNNIVNVRLKPQNGIKVRTNTTYLYDPTLIEGAVALAEDWARKQDGLVEEEGEGIDYSAKAYAIGGTGTQTNNAKYYAEQASNSATSASNSANTASIHAGTATTQAGIATTKAGEAATSATSASSSASSASSSASNSQIWAEGTDVQVSALGGTHSAKEWANIVSTSLDDYTKTSDLAAVALSNSYNDLDDKPTIGNATLTIQRNSTTVDTFTANATTNKTINITVPTKTSDITNDSGFINGIDSSDVTTALGYTPYDSSNPNGYTSNVGTVTKVNNTSPDGNGNVSISIPTVDQSYNGTSTNAQSGTAVKSAIDSAISSVYKPAGSVAFASLPALSSSIEGNVYNVTDSFTTTSDFVEGAGKTYPANTNVVCIDVSGTYKWDVLSGFVDLSGYVPTTRKVNNKSLSSDISLDASDVGAVASNASITGATKCKITYDSKGLVTAGADLSSSDVTTALGYTPYNSTNPAGYTSNVGTVTSVNSTSPDGNGNVSISVGDTLPPQTGNSGKFLTTNGSATSWATVDALPIQTGQSGKYLTTNGSSASWATVDSLPSQAGNSGKFLTTNGTTASWGTATKVTIRRFS